MPNVQDAMSSSAYALFALQQPLTLAELAAGASDRSFPAAVNHTPDWFAAAAEDSSLLQMAPELQVLPTDLEAADQVGIAMADQHAFAINQQPEVEGRNRVMPEQGGDMVEIKHAAQMRVNLTGLID